jgi:UDP-glucose-4-epimerase GalE
MEWGKQRAVLVTGGAGYIGAHTAKALKASGYLPVVFDNLSSGHREAVQWGPLVHGDIRDASALTEAMATHDVCAVLHFAGLIEVGRSIGRPDVFWDVNVGGTAQVLAAMRAAGVGRLVFSSSAAVYGQAGRSALEAISETAEKSPNSPYGDTKLAGERMIEAQCRAFGLSAVALRYFNAAGADPSGRIGEAHEPETHLLPLAIASMLEGGSPLTMFGDDFETPDGTCLRDYIHVSDLAAAHVAALEVELATGEFDALNVGAGEGRSVREVISTVSAVLNRSPRVVVGARRPGDPPSLVADPSRARARLGWTALRSDLHQIVTDAVRWELNPAYGSGRRTPQPRTPTQVAA